MASLSIAEPRFAGMAGTVVAPAADPAPVLPVPVRIDSTGAIQCLDGYPSYESLLVRICGENSARAGAISAGVRAVAEGEMDAFNLEFPYQLAEREMRMRLEGVPYREDAVEGVMLIYTDAERDDPQADKIQALGRLAGGVAHDFANLITLISGYSDILLGRVGAWDPCRPELEEIRKAAARGAATASQILDFIRKQPSMTAAVQINSLVADTMALLRPIVGEQISLAVTLDPELEAVEADSAEMTRVIMNLALNARDAMPEGGAIRVRTSNVDLRAEPWHRLAPGRYVALEVSDSGRGMDRETLCRIFQPFFSTKGRAGTGLGLSTVQRIVERAGGAIWARSEPGRGTTFTVCLPHAKRDGQWTDPHAPRRTPGTGTETILLAEDEESVRKLLRRLLDAGGYRVLEAADGREALEVLEQHAGAIHLLLTDVIMPGLNGHELATQALACRPGLKVIYMSGYADDVLSSAGDLGPGMSFLRKPLQLENLSAHIREVLDMPSVQ